MDFQQSNNNYANFLPSLRRMSSLSHLQQSARTSTPNTTLSRRSRVMKPVSSHNSPSRSCQRRRMPSQHHVMTRPVTYDPATQPPFQATQFPQQSSHFPSTHADRPITWHPTQSYCLPPQPVVTHPHYNLPYEAWKRGPQQSSNSQRASMAYNVPPQNHARPRNEGTWFDQSPNDSTLDGNALPMNGLHINQHPYSVQSQHSSFISNARDSSMPLEHISSSNSTFVQSGTLAHEHSLVTAANQAEQEEEEEVGQLVGMGLHDTSTNYEQTSLLLGAGLDEHEKPPSISSARSVLTGECSPPQEVPDTIPDEGNDTPVTNDFNDWSSPVDQLATTPLDTMQSYVQPPDYCTWSQSQQMYDLSGQSFYFEDANEITPTAWYPPLKQTTINGSGGMPWGWMGAQGSF
ncbi:MAG: hypothetical protein Q9159_001156 [Coniocarpon cinnabarinum]